MSYFYLSGYTNNIHVLACCKPSKQAPHLAHCLKQLIICLPVGKLLEVRKLLPQFDIKQQLNPTQE
jgi:hypothetical protein